MRRARAAVLVAAFFGLAAACGADPALRNAEETVRLAGRAVSDVDVASRGRTLRDLSDGERVALREVIARAEERLENAEQSVSLWRDTGSGRMGWETFAPCLASALEALRRKLTELSVPPPTALREAQARIEGAVSGRCEEF